ncbi:uncharacterized protein LOC108626479 [Ceratina calcarata]|uniref:Uncharacterized protein LOC108626479 n=1 Tax=Ceratina calcarata TaxID=156304 RepID=A0AAJ7N8U8_9HYME|nr:uncharacterized protein LOC108626479 [Ceratina calcarata]
MKRFTVFVLVTLMLVLMTINDADCKKLTMDEAKKTIKNLRKPCSKKNDTPKELLDGQFVGDFPKDERLMCYMKCILVSTKTMKNDEVQWDWFTKNARLLLIEELIPRVDHMVEVCRTRVTATDGCEVAWEFGKCVWDVDKELYLAP